MADTYVTLNEAAELESIGYDTMKKRIHRNPEKFLITKEQRETGGKKMTMVAISSLSKKARTAWKEREKLKAVAEAPVQEADQLQHQQTHRKIQGGDVPGVAYLHDGDKYAVWQALAKEESGKIK